MLEVELQRLLAMRPIPIELVVRALAMAASKADLEDLPVVVAVARKDEFLDENIAWPALVVLPAWGKPGLHELVCLVREGIHTTNALSMLVTIALGKRPSSQDDVILLGPYWDILAVYEVSDDLALHARRELRAMILDQLGVESSVNQLLSAIATQDFFSVGTKEKVRYLLGLLIDSHLILNERILEEFEMLLNAGPDREEELHRFLVHHPVLVDPFVTELRTKHQLGDDFIADFVIRRINNEYVLVEIENSTDNLFNQDGSFSSDLMKASAQVRDFQAWIADNIAYAQRKLPGIRRPFGLVVIGRREELSSIMATRLDEENFSRRGHIKVVTYDDLLDQARVVYRNMLDKPVVLRSRDQRVL